ncbi:MAG TPA: protein-glutamate O-methyltransferase CheR [Campylobacterales bacterium]|nr:protein-glutamate O-methyltransferase CheR [Campylobacterales bacterium]
MAALSDFAFEKICKLVKKYTGIHLGESKKQLVEGRLAKRVRLLNLTNFDAYYDECLRSASELQTMINIITTNETSFFREARHFEFMRTDILPHVKNAQFKVWSAAASIGAEAYSIAMLLDDFFAHTHIDWEVIGTDINTEVIEQASNGLYPIRFSEQIEKRYLKKYCLKGINSQEGQFLIDDHLKKRVKFKHANLIAQTQPEIERFDIIFLRNMLIYFDNESKEQIVKNALKALKPNGYLFIGHAETLGRISSSVRQIRPTIYKNGV